GKSGNLVGSLTISQLTPTFTVSPASFNLAPKATQSEMVTYTPDATIDIATVVINSNDPLHSTLNVNLVGHGVAGRLGAPATVTLSGPTGAAITGNLVIKNTGRGLLVVSFPTL